MQKQKIIITTSREPSRRTRSFVKELVAAIPHAEKMNRGKATLIDLRNAILRRGAYGLLMVLEKKANPSALVFYTASDEGLRKRLLIKITSVKLGREIKEYQKPLGIKSLTINPNTVPEGLPAQVAESLIQILKPTIYIDEPPLRSIEIVVLGDSNAAEVNFICTSSNRPCGPSFKAIKVINYDEERK